MAYKTILVYLDDTDRASEILKVAVGIADRQRAHLIGLYVIPPLQLHSAVEVQIPALVFDNHKNYHQRIATSLEAKLENAASQNNLAYEWRAVEAVPLSVAGRISELAQSADLLVIGQHHGEQEHGNLHDLPVGVIMGCGRPVVVVPNESRFDTLANDIFVAWDGSQEATRAVFDSIPLLQMANSVVVHQIQSEPNSQQRIFENPASLVSTLARHNINVVLSQSHASPSAVTEELLRYAMDIGADLMVMGAYGHMRLREYLFGRNYTTSVKGNACTRAHVALSGI